MPIREFKLGPWPKGINNVANAGDDVFQPPNPGESAAQLRDARDVDLDDEGWPYARHPVSLVTSLDDPQGIWSAGGHLLIQDGGELSSDGEVLIDGLAHRAAVCEHWGRVYITDGFSHYELEGGGVRTWGMEYPVISLSSAPGQLPPGRYLVQAAFIDERGNEGGTSDVYPILLTSTGGIDVSVAPALGATGTVVYMSRADQRHTSFCGVYPIGGHVRLASEPTTAANPPRTEGMRGPIDGAVGVCSHRAFVLMWRDNVIFRSEGAEPHLFHPDNIMQFAGDVTACESVDGGLWVGTSAGMYWVRGDDPTQWVPTQKTTSAVRAGSKLIDGSQFPAVESNSRVAMFVAENGLLGGRPGGELAHVTEGRYHFTPGDRASITFHQDGEHRRVLVAGVN